MSYCRWSSDSHRSDVYAYQSDTGFEIDIARYRHDLPDDAVAPTFDDPDWPAKYDAWIETLRASELVPIGLPFDGQRFVYDTEDEMMAKLAELAAIGYHVPAGLLADGS